MSMVNTGVIFVPKRSFDDAATAILRLLIEIIAYTLREQACTAGALHALDHFMCD
jgi:hypothetical protein